MTQVTSPIPPKKKKRPEDMWADMQKPSSGIYGEAIAAASKRLKNPTDGFTTDQAGQVERFYTQQYEEGAGKRMKGVQAQLRSIGMYDSGRHSEALINNEKRLSADIAQNVTVPLIMDDRDRRMALQQQTIEQAQSLGRGEHDMTMQRGDLGLRERGMSLEEKEQGQAAGIRDRMQALEEKIKSGNLSIAERQQAVDELEQLQASSVRERGMSLEEKEQGSVATAREAQTKLAQDQLALEKRLEEARLSGDLDGHRTIEKQLADLDHIIRREQVEQDQQRIDLEKRLEEARLSGDIGEQRTIQGQLADLQGEIERGQLDENQRQFNTSQTGILQSGPITLESIIDPARLRDFQTREQMRRLGEGELEAFQAEIKQRFSELAGRPPTDEEFQALWYNQPVQVQGQQTLSAQDLAQQRQLQQQQIDIQQQLADLSDKIQTAQQSGKLGEDELPTLEAQRVQLAKDQQDIDERLSYFGQAEQSRQFNVTQTGRIGTEGTVNAETLKIDLSGLVNREKGGFDRDVFDRVAPRAKAALEAAGIQATPALIGAILSGRDVDSNGQLTLAATEQATQAGMQAGGLNLEQQRVELEAEIQRDGVALEKARVMGVDVDEVKTLEAKLAEGQQKLGETELALRAEEFFAAQTGQVGRQGSVTADQLGVVIRGDETPEERATLTDRLNRAMTAAGLDPSPANLKSLMAGESIDTTGTLTLGARDQAGSQALEQQRIELEEQLRTAELSGDINGASTIKQQMATLDAERQRAQLSFDEAGLTGRYARPVTAADFGIDVSEYLNADGTLKDMDKFIAAGDRFEANFEAMYGRPLTEPEAHALAMGKEVVISEDTQAGLSETQRRTLEAEIQRDGMALEKARVMGVDEGEIKTLEAKIADKEAELDAARLKLEERGVAVEEEKVDLAEKELNINEALQGRSLDIEEARVSLQEAAETNRQALERLQALGQEVDPETGETIETLQARQFALNKQLEVADRTGKFATTASAADFGIDVNTYLNADGTLKDFDKSLEMADLLENNFKEIYGRELLPIEAHDLAMGGDIGVVLETMEGKSLDNEEARATWVKSMEEADRTGKIIDPMTGNPQLTLSAQAEKNDKELREAGLDNEADSIANSFKSFNAELRQRANESIREHNLNDKQATAAIANIYAEIENRKKALEQSAVEFISQNEQAWAQIMGSSFMGGSISAETLGVNLSSTMSDAEKRSTIERAFKTATGRAPTKTESYNLSKGYDIDVESSPTQAAKQFAATMASQDMDRAVDVSRVSNEYTIDHGKLEQYIKESDRNYTTTTQQVADKYSLDRMQFGMAKMELDARLTGKVNISGSYSAKDLGIEEPPSQWDRLTTDQKKAFTESTRDVFETLQGRALSDDEIINLAGGGKVAVQTLDTQASKEWATAARESASRFGLDEDKFLEAAGQFDAEYALSDRNTWAQLTGAAYGVEGGATEGKRTSTVGWKQYSNAKKAFDESEIERDEVWRGMMTQDQIPVNADLLIRELNFDNFEIRDASKVSDQEIQDAFYDSRGYELKSYEVQMIRDGAGQGKKAKINIGTGVALGDPDAVAAIANFVNGHSVALAPAQSSTWENIGGLVGTIATLAIAA